MAEAGGKDADNPFSFKSFMKRGSADVGPMLDTQEKPAKSTKKKNKKKTVPDVLFPEAEDKGKGNDKEDNPFSFNNFVKTKKTKQSPLVVRGSSSEDSSSDLEVHPLALNKEKPSKPSLKPVKTDPLTTKDIFDSDTDSSFSLNDEESLAFKNSDSPLDIGPPLTTMPMSTDTGLTITLSGVDKDQESDSFGSLLEDKPAVPAFSGAASKEKKSEVKKLKAENQRLKLELDASNEEITRLKEKNTALKDQMKVLKKKESEDTKALEDMVQRVESNLVATTKRATTAEATISKLTQEIKSLKIQLAQSTPHSVHQKYEEMLRGVREKANFASAQLQTASQKADQSIRDLLSGVQTLNTVAEILTFIDSVTELKDQPS